MYPRHLRKFLHQLASQRRALKQARRHKTSPRKEAPRIPKREDGEISKGAAGIECPEVLDFDLDGERSARFFFDLERALYGRAAQLIVDHRPLKTLSPAAALVLIAHLYRAYRRRPELGLFVHLPTAAQPRDLLGLIGYYRYFKGVKWEAPADAQRYYLEHKRGEKVLPEDAASLCIHLHLQGTLSTAKLYAALIEGMGNAIEWGYDRKEKGYRWWWLLGYRDDQTGEMAYSLYDQGVGIPVSIRTRFTDWFPGLRPPGSELIERAVLEGRYSRSKEKGRGTGLPTLLDFVEEGSDGELLILSNESRCIFRHGQPVRRDDFNIGLRGTLISWNFQP